MALAEWALARSVAGRFLTNDVLCTVSAWMPPVHTSADGPLWHSKRVRNTRESEREKKDWTPDMRMVHVISGAHLGFGTGVRFSGFG
ncbi:unnamed protein product [Mycena citricolor]|uniref:Uncharacterized protein n=1 Tax=Mycena citricolor TaxID=2018698 RepID=A0AAD2K8P3_9AGAR|nr:unnamed protein product [Mycena citricolor]